MNLTERVKSACIATLNFVGRLMRAMAPEVLFFFIAFGLLFLLFKLFVAQYYIEYSAFTETAVAALFLGKIVPLLDRAQSGYRFKNHRRIVVITGKTFVYALVVIILGIGERILRAGQTEGSIHAGFAYVLANANVQRFLGLVLLISMVVGVYLALQEINRAMGERALFRLFFEPPQRSGGE